MAESLERILNKIKNEFKQEIYTVVAQQIAEDLLNYYQKKDTYSKVEVNNLLENVSGLKLVIVQTLPTENIQRDTIYLLPKPDAKTRDAYDEYIYINQWEKIGSTDINTDNFITQQDMEDFFNSNQEVIVDDETPTSNTWKLWIDESAASSQDVIEVTSEQLDYYRKGQTYTKAEVNALISNLTKEYITVALKDNQLQESSRASVWLDTNVDALYFGNYGTLFEPTNESAVPYNASQPIVGRIDPAMYVRYLGSETRYIKVSGKLTLDYSTSLNIDRACSIGILRYEYHDAYTEEYSGGLSMNVPAGFSAKTISTSYGYAKASNTSYYTIDIPPTIVPINQYDVISIEATNDGTATFVGHTSGFSDYNGLGTYFTIELL